jgi:hypothetical protein
MVIDGQGKTMDKQKELEYIKKRLNIIYDAIIPLPLIGEGMKRDKIFVEQNYSHDIKYLRKREIGLYESTILLQVPKAILRDVERKLHTAGVSERPWRKSKKLKGKQLVEANDIKKRFELYVAFVRESPYWSDSVQWALEQAKFLFDLGDLHGLRSLNKDLNAKLGEQYSPQFRRGILRLWHEQVGDPTEEEHAKKSLTKLEKIIRVGKIRDDSEYEFLLDWVETNYQDKSKKAKVDQINYILADYHQKHEERGESDNS